jgi:hypothetical protein
MTCPIFVCCVDVHSSCPLDHLPSSREPTRRAVELSLRSAGSVDLAQGCILLDRSGKKARNCGNMAPVGAFPKAYQL